jgi:hypothetical protein
MQWALRMGSNFLHHDWSHPGSDDVDRWGQACQQPKVANARVGVQSGVLILIVDGLHDALAHARYRRAGARRF